MQDTWFRRGLLAIVAALVLVVAGGGIAYATSHTDSEIDGCVKQGDGLLRIVQSEADCKPGERALSWPAEGAKGYRFIWSAPPSSNIVVTATGTGDIGFPAEGESETELFRFDLPAGSYFVGTTVSVWKDSGHAELLCYIRLSSDRVTSFMRLALGTDPGYSRLTTAHSDGIMIWPGGEAALGCIQDGRLSRVGGDPNVIYATVNATRLLEITGTRIP